MSDSSERNLTPLVGCFEDVAGFVLRMGVESSGV